MKQESVEQNNTEYIKAQAGLYIFGFIIFLLSLPLVAFMLGLSTRIFRAISGL